MLVQPRQDLRLVPPLTPAPDELKIAVLLNANARKVTDAVVRKLSHVVPAEDLYLSRSELDARRIAQQVVDRGYHAVFCGGGDGTFVGFVNEILHQVELRSRYHAVKAPKFGILKLGTGNGMAAYVNASPLKGDRILDDVLRARSGEIPGFKPLDLLLVDGKRCQFAGVGVDGKLLNDYLGLKNSLGKGPFKPLASGAFGYFNAVAFKTVPYCFARGTWTEIEVTNGKTGPAYRLGADGAVIGEFAPGETIFQGDAMMAAAATMPFYGYEFRMFPFAGKRRRMFQLRLGRVGTAHTLVNLPKLWKGKWFPEEKILDFYANDVSIKFAKPMPFQIGGDAAGYRPEVRFQIAPESVELVDYTGAVN
jgi:diacylglycerol kinase family enzyme